MLLAVDVGNTNIVVGVFEDRHLLTNWRLATDSKRSADEYGVMLYQMFRYEGLDPSDIDDVIISTVVPSVQFALEHMSYKYFHKKPLIVATGIKTGLKIKYDDPRQVGSDRIVNAVAAHHKYKGDLIIIDFGTATTFCAVTGEGEYLGGTIAPGIKISAQVLFEQTAKLPNVELYAPGKMIGKNTIESMQSGLIYGHMGMTRFIVEGMKDEMRDKYGCDRDAIRVIATGGMSNMMEEGAGCIDVIEKRLTLDGLACIYEKNKSQRKKQ